MKACVYLKLLNITTISRLFELRKRSKRREMLRYNLKDERKLKINEMIQY